MSQRRAPQHSPENIDRALLALAVHGGNSGKAARELEANGFRMSDRTLRNWREKYQDRYAELAHRHQAKVEQVVVAQTLETVVKAGEVERELLDKLQARQDELSANEVANALRNASTTRGIALDKYLLLSGRPTQVVETRNVEDIIRSLRAKGIDPAGILSVDGTASEAHSAGDSARTLSAGD